MLVEGGMPAKKRLAKTGASEENGGMQNPDNSPLVVQRWPSETPLTWLVGFLAAFIWFILVFSIFGIIYAGFIFLALFLAHVGFITHVRGSAVKLSPEQFPEIHESVQRLAQRIGFEKVPDAYILQEGGALNALATRFFKSNLLILFSDLLEACGNNIDARDLIIAHELGHLKEGHLKWHWFLLPGLIYPFLGQALSRAREYTCDRYGFAAARNKEAALQGLAILAAGAQRGPQVNLQALAHQVRDINTGWLTLGQWLGSHPPLSRRLIALNPGLAPSQNYSQDGILRALGIIGLVYVLPIFLLVFALIGFSVFNLKNLPTKTKATDKIDTGAAEISEKRKQAKQDILELARFVEQGWKATGKFPKDINELYDKWNEAHPEKAEPLDPLTNQAYHYTVFEDGENYELWSNGPDQEKNTNDDIFTTHKKMTE